MNKDQVVESIIGSQLAPGMKLRDGAEIFEASLPPELCRNVLAFLNTNNVRRIAPEHVRKMLDDRSHDRWGSNYSTIVFAGESFELLDGQHRLAASVNSDTPLDTLVVIFAAESSKMFIDTNIKTRGIPITHGVQYGHRATVGVLVDMAGQSSRALTVQAIADMYQVLSPLMNPVAEMCAKRKLMRNGSVAAAFVAALLLNKSRKDDVYDFLQDIVDMTHRLPGTIEMVAYRESRLPTTTRKTFIRVGQSMEARCSDAHRYLSSIETFLGGGHLRRLAKNASQTEVNKDRIAAALRDMGVAVPKRTSRPLFIPKQPTGLERERDASGKLARTPRRSSVR